MVVDETDLQQNGDMASRAAHSTGEHLSRGERAMKTVKEREEEEEEEEKTSCLPCSSCGAKEIRVAGRYHSAAWRVERRQQQL